MVRQIGSGRMIAVAISVGVLLGSTAGVAHGDLVFKFITAGSAYESFQHSSSAHSFTDSHSRWANAAYPNTTGFSVYSAVYSGGSGVPGTWFGLTRLYDAQNQNPITFPQWQCDHISTNPSDYFTWSQALSSSNNGVVFNTQIFEGLCWNPQDSYYHKSNWVAQP